MNENAFTRFEVSNETKTLGIVEKRNDSDSWRIIRKFLFLGDPELNVFRIDFFTLFRISASNARPSPFCNLLFTILKVSSVQRQVTNH